MTFLTELFTFLAFILLILVIIVAIVYLPYWILMQLFKSSSFFIYPKRSYRQYRCHRNKRQAHSFQTKKTKKQEPTVYDILQCTPYDDNKTIKKTYRSLVKKYHPDHISAENKNEITLKNAKMKMQQINDAYETVKKLRGLKR